ncbi:hypothetical protein [Microbacterium sp. 2MCAF23]|uniref:hypothetical protein n=1 Tax=Microbacterium sp. 2MCAF23 TaxID=3232985 RepID=UPI003F9A3F09
MKQTAALGAVKAPGASRPRCRRAGLGMPLPYGQALWNEAVGPSPGEGGNTGPPIA